MSTTFVNVARPNGLEAWRRLAEPINEEKEILLKELLLLVTNPMGPASMDKVEGAIEDWDANIRLFVQAG